MTAKDNFRNSCITGAKTSNRYTGNGGESYPKYGRIHRNAPMNHSQLNLLLIHNYDTQSTMNRRSLCSKAPRESTPTNMTKYQRAFHR